MKISGAIFDVDDTLTRSEWVWKGIPEKFLKRHGKVAEPGLDETLMLLNTAQIGELEKKQAVLEEDIRRRSDTRRLCDEVMQKLKKQIQLEKSRYMG